MDVSKARQDTPHCEAWTHFNNAGKSLSPSCVLNAAEDFTRAENTGGYWAATERSNQLDTVYTLLAELLDCAATEIAVFGSGTRAWQIGFHSICQTPGVFNPGDIILTGRSEYSSNIVELKKFEHLHQAQLQVVEDDEHGQISLDALRQAIVPQVKMIALTHTPTNGGLVNPAAEVGKIAKENGILYILDAVQTIGQTPVSFEEIGCDLMIGTGRKYLRGPRGTGFFCIRQSLLDTVTPIFLDNFGTQVEIGKDGQISYIMRDDARRFEQYEENYALKRGLGVATEYLLAQGIQNIWEYVSRLADYFRSELRAIPGVEVQDLGKERCGIVSFTATNLDLVHLKERFRKEAQVNVSVSKAPSTPFDMYNRNLEMLLRASVHYYNTEAEIQTFCSTLRTFL